MFKPAIVHLHVQALMTRARACCQLCWYHPPKYIPASECVHASAGIDHTRACLVASLSGSCCQCRAAKEMGTYLQVLRIRVDVWWYPLLLHPLYYVQAVR